MLSVYQHSLRRQMPNPSVNRTANGLRPSSAGYLERWASYFVRASEHRLLLAPGHSASSCLLSAPIAVLSAAFKVVWAVRPSAVSELLRRLSTEEELNVLRESLKQAEAMSPDRHSEQRPLLPFGLNYVASVGPGLVASFVTAGHQWAKLWHGFGTAGAARSGHSGCTIARVIVEQV